jgi:hypothetical protein
MRRGGKGGMMTGKKLDEEKGLRRQEETRK